MTTMTMNSLNARFAVPAPRFAFRRFAQLRAALPSMKHDSALHEAATAAGRFTLALVPFAALGWMFIAL